MAIVLSLGKNHHLRLPMGGYLTFQEDSKYKYPFAEVKSKEILEHVEELPNYEVIKEEEKAEPKKEPVKPSKAKKGGK